MPGTVLPRLSNTDVVPELLGLRSQMRHRADQKTKGREEPRVVRATVRTN